MRGDVLFPDQRCMWPGGRAGITLFRPDPASLPRPATHPLRRSTPPWPFHKTNARWGKRLIRRRAVPWLAQALRPSLPDTCQRHEAPRPLCPLLARRRNDSYPSSKNYSRKTERHAQWSWWSATESPSLHEFAGKWQNGRPTEADVSRPMRAAFARFSRSLVMAIATPTR